VKEAKFFNDTVQYAGWNATPEHKGTLKAYGSPILIKQENEKRKKTLLGNGTAYEYPEAKYYLTQ
jgi:hypothetical protein